MFDFYERTNRWWALLGPEITDIPVLAKANADVSRALHGLYAEALAGVETSPDQSSRRSRPPRHLHHTAPSRLTLDQATDIVTDAVTQQARKHPHP